jgi:DNA adenine methylase
MHDASSNEAFEPTLSISGEFNRSNSTAKISIPDSQFSRGITPSLFPEAQPFLKWAGGKGQLLKQFDRFFPKSVDRYVEPFLGGGAVFFHLKSKFPQMKACLRDSNDELINIYLVVRDDPYRLMDKLDCHLKCYAEDPKHHYYDTRDQHQLEDAVERAARMLFLNKTCFNGLWRVNARGNFNVPMGTFKKVTLYDRQNLLAASRALHDAKIKVQDFRGTLKAARKGDFLYVDPPYHPVSPTSAFTAYTKDDFGEEAQKDLARLYVDAAKKGVKLMLSNSDSKFIRKLYEPFRIYPVKARRAINCRAESRGIVSEVVVTNYDA